MLLVLVGGTLAAVFPPFPSTVRAASVVTAPLAQTAFNVNGTVFRDFNNNGLLTTGARSDIGLAGVVVTAYDSTGAAVGTTTTASNGAYSFTPSAAGPYRIEFTNLPDGYEPSGSGTNERTSVRFVTSSANNPVHFGVNHPCDYCQTDTPTVVGSKQVNGNQSSNPVETTVLTFAYDAHTDAFEASTEWTRPTTFMTDDETGSVWGIAYHRDKDQLFFASFLKRHVGFLNGRTGAIYSPDSAGNLYVDLASLGISAGTDPRTASDGTVNSPNELPASSLGPSWDAAAYTLVGKLGLGDIDIDADGTMWIVNLFQRSLHGITNVDATVTPTTANRLGGTTGYQLTSATTGVTCTNGVLRPFGVKAYRDLVYVGAVCTGENSGATFSNVTGHIFSFDPSNPGSFTQVLGFSFPEYRDYFYFGSGTDDKQWRTWRIADTTFTWAENNPHLGGPMIGDIEFTASGNMVIGIKDRFGDQAGPLNYFPDATATNGGFTGREIQANGDVMHACKTTTGWAFQGTASCPITGAEFYTGDYGPQPTGNAGNPVTFLENGLGALALLPGSDEVMTTAHDPARFWGSGIIRLDTSNGSHVDQYAWYGDRYSTAPTGESPPDFYKAGGLGDIELLCDPAPLEIGSRLWLDTDADGIQDAGEAGIANATVTLWADTDGNGSVDAQVGSDVTDADGEYFFGGINNTSMTGGNTVNTYTAYEIRVSMTQAATSAYTLTTANAAQPANGNATATDNDPITDVADSDATLSSTTAVIAYTTEGAGMNNHGLDIGVTDVAPVVSLGSYIWADVDRDGIQDSGESGIAGAVVSLQVDNGSGTFVAATDIDGTAVTAQTTGADGLYYFDNLPEGTYRIQVTPPSGYSYVTSAQDSNANNNEQNDSNIASVASGVYTSASITLSDGAEPTESGLFAGDTQDDAANTNGNMTLDMGLVPVVSLGSYIWEDADRDGVQDSGESPIQGAVVNLLSGTFEAVTDINGTAVATQTTGADGLYYFDNLPEAIYRLEVTLPAGYSYVANAQDTTANGDEEDDSNIRSVSGNTFTSYAITLNAGAEPTESGAFAGDGQDNAANTNGNMTLDMGFVPVVSLGSYIWEDTDKDGVQDAGESGISGATVALQVDSGSGTFVTATDISGTAITDQTTGADGLYYFDNLPEGTYRIQVTPPSGYSYVASAQDSNANNDEQNDSNIASVASGVYTSASITLSNGGEPTESGAFAGDGQDDAANNNGNMTLDMGFVPVMSLGSYIWNDLDGDGVQDVGIESGISGVTVALLVDNGSGTFVAATDISGTLVADQTTGADGLYFFQNLPEGIYKIAVTPPSGYGPSPVQNTTDDTVFESDSNIASVSGNTYTSIFQTLTGGGEGTETGTHAGDTQDDAAETNGNMTLDIGFVQLPALSITKVMNTPEPVRTGDPISFTITILNSGPTTIAVLPLEDTYDRDYISYVNASPASVDNTDDGTINWTDLTVSFGSDLAPGADVEVVVYFTAVRDTGALPNQTTVNYATVSGAEDTNGNTPDDVTDNDDVEVISPTAVYLSSRSAARSGGSVELSWVTVDESQIAAFRIVRTNSDGTEVMLTSEPISAQFTGQPTGTAYGFTDTDLTGQGTVRYNLEVLSVDGSVSRVDLGRVHAGASIYLPLVDR